MNHLAKRTLQGALLIGGLWVIGQGIASADTVSAPANVPVIACGNSVGILSSPAASCPANSSTGASTSAAASATDVSAPISIPISVTGNSVGVLAPAGSNPSTGTGTAPATGGTSNTATAGAAPATGSGSGSTGGLLGNGGLLGTGLLSSVSAQAPVNAPVLACGNAVGVGADPSAACPTGTSSTSTSTGGSTGSGSTGTGSVGSGLLGTGLLGDGGLLGTGLLSSASAQAPVNAPVLVCGNAVGVGADPSSGCPTGTGANSTTSTTGSTSPSSGLLADLPISIPLTVCGNGVGVLGSGSASCGGVDAVSVTDPGTPGSPTNPVIPTTPGGSSSNPFSALLASSNSLLASTGSDLKAVLAFALALLSAGGALSLFARNWSTATS